METLDRSKLNLVYGHVIRKDDPLIKGVFDEVKGSLGGDKPSQNVKAENAKPKERMLVLLETLVSLYKWLCEAMTKDDLIGVDNDNDRDVD